MAIKKQPLEEFFNIDPVNPIKKISVTDSKKKLGSISTDQLRKAANENLPQSFESMWFQLVAQLHADAVQGVNIKECLKAFEVSSKYMFKPAESDDDLIDNSDEERSEARKNILNNLKDQTKESGKIVNQKVSAEKLAFAKQQLENRRVK